MAATTKTWLSEMGNRVGNGLKRSLASDIKKQNRHYFRQEKPPTLEILAFETAKAMSRLVSLYKSLSDDEIIKLRKVVMRSQGVTFLNSEDEGFLLKLAYAERIEDLDRAAVAVGRLGKKCSDPGLNRFEQVYTDLKLGFIDLSKLDFVSKEIDKIIDKMEKFISTTSSLYSGLEALAEMEVSERKIKQWKKYNGSIQTQKTNSDLFDQKLSWQRQKIRQLKEVSLWGQTFDKSVGLMGRTVCIVYARICVLFGPYISGLPRVSPRHMRFPLQDQIQFHPELPCPVNLSTLSVRPSKEVNSSKSGPILKPPTKLSLIRFWSQELEPLRSEAIGFGVGFGIGFKENHSFSTCGTEKTTRVKQQAPPSTVGGSGLSLRYANVIILVEKYLNSPCKIDDSGRENLYQMLPASLKMLVRSKLKHLWRNEDEEFGLWEDESLAEGWRCGLKGILEWLAPMAHDTVRWHTERNFEKQNFDAKPMVVLLQTLFFADKEKTEAAIAEVLVGLSCICRYEIRRS